MKKEFLKRLVFAAVLICVLMPGCKQDEDGGEKDPKDDKQHELVQGLTKAELDKLKTDAYNSFLGEWEAVYQDDELTTVKVEKDAVTLDGERYPVDVPGDLYTAIEANRMDNNVYYNPKYEQTFNLKKEEYGGYTDLYVRLEGLGFRIFDSMSTSVINEILRISKVTLDKYGHLPSIDFYRKQSGGGNGESEESGEPLPFSVAGTWKSGSSIYTSNSITLNEDGTFDISKSTGAQSFSDCTYTAAGSKVTFRFTLSTKAGSASNTTEVEDVFSVEEGSGEDRMTLVLVSSKTAVDGVWGEPSSDISTLIQTVWTDLAVSSPDRLVLKK